MGETSVEGHIINVRRLVALDITLHGPRFIAFEFGVGTPVILVVGTVLLMYKELAFGTYLFLAGVNYVPLFVYMILIVRGSTAGPEVAEYKAHDIHYVRKYSVQQLLLFLPLVVFALAVWQELRSA